MQYIINFCHIMSSLVFEVFIKLQMVLVVFLMMSQFGIFICVSEYHWLTDFLSVIRPMFQHPWIISPLVYPVFASLSLQRQKEGSLIPSSCMKASSLSDTPVERARERESGNSVDGTCLQNLKETMRWRTCTAASGHLFVS